MDDRKFTDPTFGKPRRQGATFSYFVPDPLPRELVLEPETVLSLSNADNALGRLASAGKYLKDPAVFVRPYMTREAVASSRIEGTQASLSDVLQANAGGETPDPGDILEVQNYIKAMDLGADLLGSLPISQRLISELHETLMKGVRGEDRKPGELREGPVFIGSSGDSFESAVFVPPLHPLLPDLLTDWEDFANNEPRLPILVQCAMLHYQFETIHPFMDGNGRVGRLLIAFFLMSKGRLRAPLLYLSAYLEQNRRDYYERLQAVREQGQIQEWIRFFLAAVTAQANDGVARAEKLFELREQYRGRLAGSRSRASEVVEIMFENPFMTAKGVSDRLGMTPQGATKLIGKLEEEGLVTKLGSFGRGGRQWWLATEVLQIIEAAEVVALDDSPPQMTLGG